MTDRGAVCRESRLSGSERGWSATLVWMKYCGTAGKPGGKQRKQTSSYSPGSLQPTRTAPKEGPHGSRGVGCCGKPTRLQRGEGRRPVGRNGQVHHRNRRGKGPGTWGRIRGDNVGKLRHERSRWVR